MPPRRAPEWLVNARARAVPRGMPLAMLRGAQREAVRQSLKRRPGQYTYAAVFPTGTVFLSLDAPVRYARADDEEGIPVHGAIRIKVRGRDYRVRGPVPAEIATCTQMRFRMRVKWAARREEQWLPTLDLYDVVLSFPRGPLSTTGFLDGRVGRMPEDADFEPQADPETDAGSDDSV